MVNELAKSLTQTIAVVLAIAFIALLTVSCGGSGGGSSTRTGVFEDALVSGLGYSTVPGGISGTTNAIGEFNFEKDDVITFLIGDVVLGSARAKSRMSPLDLVSGTTGIEDPAVVNMARFLQSLDVNENANLIELPPGLADVVNSWLIIHSETPFGFDPDVYAFDSMATDLLDYLESQLAAYSSGLELVDADDALEHMTSTLLEKFDGSYNGKYAGDDSGDWCFRISRGMISGTAWDQAGESFDLFGAIDPGGGMVVGTADDLTLFNGAVDENGNISGTWLYSNPFDPPSEDGHFSGKTGTCPFGDDPAAEADNDGDGYTTAQGDCDDGNLDVFPGAVEICGNGIDEDCSGSDLSCDPNEVAAGDDLALILGSIPKALGNGGGAVEAAEMIEAVIDDMGLEQIMTAETTVLDILSALNGYEGACGKVRREGTQLVYTITNGNDCILKSGTVTVSRMARTDNEVSALVVFADVRNTNCSLTGSATVEIRKNDSSQLVIDVVFVNMTTCNGNVSGTLEAVYSSAADILVSANAQFTASYLVQEKDVDADADIEYSPAGGIDGTVIFTIVSGGDTYQCTFNNVVLTDCGGVLVATSGTMVVAYGKLTSDVTFDFSDTTCENPSVTVSVNGVLVDFAF